MPVKTKTAQNKIDSATSNWEFKKIEELIEDGAILGHLDGNHGELYPRSHEFKGYGIPYIGATDFLNGFVNFADCKHLAEARANQFRKGVAKNGDILFAHNATVGPVALLVTPYEFVILSTTATYFRCDLSKLDNIFLKYALQAQQFVSQYRAVMAQSTRFQVPITAQRKLALTVPPLNEQRAIATALSDVDSLINSLDRLIAKKRDIKQATMQQLLTGKIRLPGFSKNVGFKQTEIGLIPEDWSAEPLGPRVTIVSGGSPSGYAFEASKIPYFKVEQLNSDSKYIEQTPYSCNCGKMVQAGSIIFPKRGASILLNKVRILKQNSFMDTNLMTISPDSSLDNEFLYYALTFIELWRIADTTSIPQINNKHIKPLILAIPLLEEQRNIGRVLSDWDAEISALEQRRDKTLLLKQGMMQELLTGRIRLV